MQTARCPRCAKKGLDTSGDNLAIYSDGHEHCFACGYHKGIPVDERLRQLAYDLEPVKVEHKSLDFPSDYTSRLSPESLSWLRGFGVSDVEIEKHRIGFSPSKNLLLFPVLDGEGHMLMWQGRDFNENPKSKYLTKGNPTDILHLVGPVDDDTGIVVVTEDLVSAIKVGRVFTAMPLWGSHMPLGTIRRLSERFATLGVWLDKDKQDVALKTVLRASQYMPSFMVASMYDPKCYESSIVDSMVMQAKGETIYKEIQVEKTTTFGTDFSDNPKNRSAILSMNPHDPEPGETYQEWCERLFVPPCEKALADFRHRCEKRT